MSLPSPLPTPEPVAESAALHLIASLTETGEGLSTATLQQLLTLLVKSYASRLIAAESFGDGPPTAISPFVVDTVTATEVMVTVSAMLDAVRLNLFELGMWQHIGRFQVRDDVSPER